MDDNREQLDNINDETSANSRESLRERKLVLSREEAKEVARKELEKAQQNFANREVREPRRGNKWLSLVFFVAVLALTLYLMYQLSQSATGEDQKSFAEIVGNMRVDYALASVGILLAVMILDSLKYFIIIHAITGKFCYGMALKTGLWGKYYDNITPFSSGGQPFQVHYLYKKGLSGGESTAIISIKFCFNIIIWLAICLFLMVFNRQALTTYVTDASQRELFTVLGWVGFGINCLIPLAILAFALFPKMTEAAIRKVMTIGNKLHLVKNRDAIVEKAKRGSNDFRAAFVIMNHKPFHGLLLMICCFCELALSMALPYFVVVAMGADAITPSRELMLAIMTLNVYVSMSVTAVPTPGNSGALESAFLLILTGVAESVLFWSVFAWRFLSYYTYIIAGMCVLIADFVRKNKQK